MSPIEPTAVLRGLIVAAQPVSPVVRRLRGALPAGASPAPEPAGSGASATLHDIHAAAREHGYREGWAEGHKAATAAAREEVLAQAQSLIAQAADEAARAAHAQESERLQEAARQQGQALQTRIEALVGELPQAITRRLEDAQDDILALCAEVVARLVGTVAVRPEAIRGAVVQALMQVRTRPLVSIALHESDLAVLRALPDAERWMQQMAPQAQWVASPEVAVGGCVVQSPEGGLDARLDTQLQAFVRLLRESRESQRGRVPRPLPTEGGPAA